MGYELYVITDTVIGRGRLHEEIARLAIRGGADVVQLRDKEMGRPELVATGRRIAVMARKAGILFIVNDRLDVALACGAGGVHLGQDDQPAATARAIAAKDFIIGVSVGSSEEARRAVNDGADYLAASPVFPTGSKTDAISCCGLEGIRSIRSAVRVPVVAVGGINIQNVDDVINAGADGIAVISAVVGQQDITGAARALKEQVIRAKRIQGASGTTV